MSTKWERDMLSYAASIGIESPRIEHGGRHPHIVGTVNGKTIDRAIAGSPSDGYRARTKARCDLRRAMKEVQQEVNHVNQ